jgi:hypothetical protein
MQYNAGNITTHNWAELKQITSNEWQRDWNITLKSSIPKSTNLEVISKELSYEGFFVTIETDDARHLKVSVRTTDWGWEDYLYSNTYKMFEEINHILGTIEIIQGQARDSWYPWLWRTRNPHSSYDLSRIIMRKIELGLRIDTDKGLSFFGLEEVNNLLQDGASVISLEPEGVISKELDSDSENKGFAINGFIITVKIKEPGIETE